MNDLPDNELFSAYLDGELSAAEQAEMERLLAANPAARQLLDELRTLSTTLQSLPSRKVGEDLSQRVLRVAERRMLAGEDSSPPEPVGEPPVPLVRSIFHRFTTPRVLIRLALIAGVALMITIHDRSRQAERGGREVALAPPPALTDLQTKPRDYEPMSIHARPEPAMEKTTNAKAAPSSNALPEHIAESPTPLAFDSSANRPSEPAAQPAARDRAAEVDKIARVDKIAQVGENMLVVRCDVSPEAAKKGEFDKLLGVNGITWQDGSGQLAQVAKLQSLNAPKKAADQKEKQEPTAEEKSPPADAAGQVELVYVEATPAQVMATLSGLSSQPQAFSSVSIQPEHSDAELGGTDWQAIVRQQVRDVGANDKTVEMPTQPAKAATTAPAVSGKAEPAQVQVYSNALSNVGQGRAQRIQLMDLGDKGGQQGQVTAAMQKSPSQQTAAGFGVRRNAGAAAGERQESSPAGIQMIQQSPRSSSQQRVLFVLRVVGSDQSALQATKSGPAEAERDAAKPTASPAAEPTEQKP